MFETEIWQGEGRPVLDVAAPGVTLRATPAASAPPVEGATLAMGDRLEFDSTRIRTTSTGAFVSIASGTVSGRNFGPVIRVSRSAYYAQDVADTSLRTTPGDSVEYLQYRAEGTCFVRLQGMVIDANPCPTARQREFRLTREPELEWWIRVIRDSGKSGWLLMSDSTARVIGRRF
ncbi:MAG: hypothetical protein ABIP66_15540 [Gemmatimonadaceae bacterium]